MTRSRLRSALAALAVALAACGCNRTDSADERVAAPRGDAGADKSDPGRAAPEPRRADPPADSPQAAVRRVLEGLRNDRPHVLWESLPASYQSDVNDLAHEFAERMDPEVWRRTFATASRLLEVLRTKKELAVPWLAQLPPMRAAGPTNEQDLSAAYDELLRMFGLIVESEVSDLEQLKAIDAGRYLDRTGTRLMEQMSDWSRLSPDDPFENEFKRWLADVKVAPVSRQGDQAVLRITAADALGEPIERDWKFVRVEGKWVPADWAAGWDERIDETRRALERFTSQTVAESKPLVLKRLAAVDAVLDDLERATTPGEFQLLMSEKVVAPIMLAVRGGGAKPTPPPARPDGGGSRVEVFVRGELGPEIREELQLRLSEAGDAIVGVPRVEEDGVRFEVAPIANVEEFARQLDFVRVVKVDPQRRTVTAEIPQD